MSIGLKTGKIQAVRVVLEFCNYVIVFNAVCLWI
nr:MAG TPA: hypothetical protein [Caudoviricetes sp.]